ncbi:MAG: nucleotide exchange factor GrpE [Patescibacteria group bacterium]
MPHKKDKAEKKNKHEDFENLYKRALADYQNLVKQTTKEKEEFARYVKGNLIMEFIPIYENLKIAVDHADSKNHDSWLQGVQFVIKQFEDMLANNGVQIINPVDEQFNPAEHEAVEKVETEDEKQVDKIVKIVKQGYKMGNKVIQPAKVVVYSLK